MKLKVIKIIILTVFIPKLIFGGELRDRALETIKNHFHKNVIVNEFKYSLPSEIKTSAENFSKQRFYGNFVYYYEIEYNDSLNGYAILDNTLGKVKPITFLVIFNNNLSVSHVEIIKYREEHGGEVENKSWLSQFTSKSIEATFEVNNDIDGITGATISVKSITKGVKRLLYLINKMDKNEKDLFVSVE